MFMSPTANVQERHSPLSSTSTSGISAFDVDESGLYKCPKCPRKYRNSRSAGRHFREKHQRSHQKIACNRCGQSFLRRDGLELHARERCKAHHLGQIRRQAPHISSGSELNDLATTRISSNASRSSQIPQEHYRAMQDTVFGEVDVVAAGKAYDEISEDFDQAIETETINQRQRQAASKLSMAMWRKLVCYFHGKLPQDGNEFKRIFSDGPQGQSTARVSFVLGGRTLEADESMVLLFSLSRNGRRQWAKEFGCSADLYLRLRKDTIGFSGIDIARYRDLLNIMPDPDLRPTVTCKIVQWYRYKSEHRQTPSHSPQHGPVEAQGRIANRQQYRERKSQIRQFVYSFRKTHRKLEISHLLPDVFTSQFEAQEEALGLSLDPWVSNFDRSPVWMLAQLDHQTWSYQDAKKAGFTAVQKLFDGNLPHSSNLTGVLGLAQVASAMRDVIAGHKASKKTRLVSRKEFGNDLDRLRCLLNGRLLSTWDACTSAMWNKDGRSSVNWLGQHQDRDATVSYFQGLFDMFLASSGMSSSNLDSDLDCQYPQDVVKNSGYPEIDLDDCDAFTPTLRSKSPYMQFAFIAAGAIFGLLLAFLIFWNSHAITLVETYGDLSPCTQDMVDFLDKIYGPILQMGSLPTSFKSHYDAALQIVRDGTIDTISAFEEALLQGVHNVTERISLSAKFEDLAKTWNAWIEKASFLNNIHLLELWLGLPHAQLDPILNTSSYSVVNREVTPSAMKPSQAFQEISDAVDKIMDVSDLNCTMSDTSDETMDTSDLDISNDKAHNSPVLSAESTRHDSQSSDSTPELDTFSEKSTHRDSRSSDSMREFVSLGLSRQYGATPFGGVDYPEAPPFPTWYNDPMALDDPIGSLDLSAGVQGSDAWHMGAAELGRSWVW